MSEWNCGFFFFEACSINQRIRNKQMINKALGIGMYMQAGRRKGSRGERGESTTSTSSQRRVTCLRCLRAVRYRHRRCLLCDPILHWLTHNPATLPQVPFPTLLLGLKMTQLIHQRSTSKKCVGCY